MAKTADNRVEQRTGTLPRPIPEAISQLSLLLANEAKEDDVAALVAELETDYVSVRASFGVAVQHEKDCANTMGSIRQALSDSRLEKLGIHSDLAITPPGKPISRPERMRDCA